MPSLLVRDVPAEVVRRIKKRAAAHGRSLQAELRQGLIDLAGPDLARVRAAAARLRKKLGRTVHPDSARSIREDRDR